MTRLVLTSDLHANLPEIPECDVLVIAGDLTMGFKADLRGQQRWLFNQFRPWLDNVPATHTVIVAGNHDQCIEQWGWPGQIDCNRPIHVDYLEDSGVELCGLKFWGTPWQPWFYNWAFNAPQRHGELFLEDKFSKIPEGTDVLICHGPPHGFGDQVGDPTLEDRSGQPHVGSYALLRAIDRMQPRLMVCGHIHSGRGVYTRGATTIMNVAHVDQNYAPVYPPQVVDI